MKLSIHRLPPLVVAFAWAGITASLVTSLAFDLQLRGGGRGDLSGVSSEASALFLLAIVSAGVVGTVLALRRTRNPVGWLFLGLAFSIAISGAADSYGVYGAVYHPGSLPAARLVAVYGDAAFLPWVCLLALILLVTPTGSAPSSRWKLIGWASAVSGSVFLIAVAFRSVPVDSSPARGIVSPLAREPFAQVADYVSTIALVVAHLALLGAIGSLLYRALHASGVERQQLRWLIVPAIPFPFLVGAAWVAAGTGLDQLLALLAGAYLLIIPIAAALAIEKQRLYDVDRIVSRTVAYTVLSLLVVSGYFVVVLTVGTAGGRAASSSVPAAVGATLAAVGLGGLLRRRLQSAVDRRFNRRSFTALETVRRHVRMPFPSASIEQVLRDAALDPGLTVAFSSDGQAMLVAEDGTPRTPEPGALELRTAEGTVAVSIAFDEKRVQRTLMEDLAIEARPELENARLRAAIALQLAEVRESRARIVAAQLHERQRIERDLHDGSQQRLLALAMNLRATEMGGDRDAAFNALRGAIEQIQVTVRELRELANGLHPGVLQDGGLAPAFQELAARAPIPIRLEVLEKRLAASVESSAWFIACEAVTNIVKHARATSASIGAAEESGMLVLQIDDDGLGGADVQGHGLRGMADRAEAAGGSFSVTRAAAGGTSIRAVIPCES